MILHAPRHHAHVCGVHNHHNSCSLQLSSHRIRHLVRNALLYLQPLRVGAHYGFNDLPLTRARSPMRPLCCSTIYPTAQATSMSAWQPCTPLPFSAVAAREAMSRRSVFALTCATATT